MTHSHNAAGAMLPIDALENLKAGNRRFSSNQRDADALASQAHRPELAAGQKPHAIVLGCADSRVPAELVFDQGLGDLFVVRVAGNIAAPSQVGSIEFAVQSFGVPLIVVLGHSNCGAIRATIDELEQPTGGHSPDLTTIVDQIKPAIAALMDTSSHENQAELIAKGIRANVSMAANHLRHGSQVLQEKVNSGELWVVGAEYSLETGVVEFFDGVPNG
jgi:carbonic anhydrase